MTAPTIDGTASANTHAASSLSVSLTTTKTNDVVVIYIAYETTTAGDTTSVSSVTSSGLTFTKRATQQYSGSTIGLSGTHPATNNLDIWWAPASSVLTSQSISITFNKTMDAAACVVFGVNGAYSISSPFDNDASLPVSGTGNGTTNPTLTFSTTENNDLILAAWCETGNNTGFSTTTGTSGTYSQIATTTNASGTNWCKLKVDSASQSSAQTSVTAHNSTTFYWPGIIGMVNVITADNNTTGFTLTAAAGSYTVTGESASLLYNRKLTATQGSYGVTGEPVTAFTLDTGLYTYTGNAVTFTSGVVDYTLSAATGYYTVYGNSVSYTANYALHSSFATLNNTGYKDWGTTDFPSYFYASYSIPDNIVWSMTPYAYTFMKETSATDSLYLQLAWDWQNDPSSKRITPLTQLYRYQDGFLVSATKHKMRGKGRAIQARFTAENGKNFNILGWALVISTNIKP